MDGNLGMVVGLAPALPPKKRPGRPKKISPQSNIARLGIVSSPADARNQVEIVYTNPVIFKKIVMLYKQYAAANIEILFGEGELQIVGTDHLGKTLIYTTVHGAHMDRYYCETPIRVSVKVDNLEKAIRVLNKHHHQIIFILCREYRSTMHMVVSDQEYQSHDTYAVDVVMNYEDGESLFVEDDADYPLKFKLNAKHFKSRINQIRGLSSTFFIQKSGGEPLQFTFDGAPEVNWTGVYGNPESIGLESQIADGDMLSAGLSVFDIKPFALGNLGSEIYIAADKHRKMSFTTHLDEVRGGGHAAEIKIFVELKGA